MNWRIVTAFLIVGAVWGSAWMLIPSLPGPPMLAGVVRFAIAATLLFVIVAPSLVRRARDSDRIRHALPIAPSVLLGVTLIGLPYALAVWAKDAVSTGVVAVMYAAMPLAALFFSQDSNIPSRIPAMTLGMGGIAMVVGQGIDYSTRQIGGILLLGAAVGLGAFSLNYAKRHIRRGHFLLSSAIQCAVAAVLLVLLSGTGGWPSPVQWNWSSVAMLAALAAAGGVIALPLLLWLLCEIEAWQVATLQWLGTLIAVAEAGWFLRGNPTMEMGAGGVMAAGAMLWLMWRGVESEDQPDAVTLQITSAEERALRRSDSEQG